MSADDEIPIVAVRDGVLFPGQIAPYDIGRPSSRAALEQARAMTPSRVVVLLQKSPSTEEPDAGDLHPIGCLAELASPSDAIPSVAAEGMHVVLHGLGRVRLSSLRQRTPCLLGCVEVVPDQNDDGDTTAALDVAAREIAKRLVTLTPDVPAHASSLIDSIRHPGHLADLLAANLHAAPDQKMALLEAADVEQRQWTILRLLMRQEELLAMRARISRQVEDERAREPKAPTDAPPGNDELREHVLRLQERFLRVELESDESPQASRWGSLLRAVGWGRTSMPDHIAEQLRVIRRQQRREVIALQLEAIHDALALLRGH